MKKWLLTISLYFVASSVIAQSYEANNIIFESNIRSIYETVSLSIDQNNNKYVFGLYSGQISIDTISLSSNGVGILLAKYNKNDKLVWAKTVAQSTDLNGFQAGVVNSSCDLEGNIYSSLLFRNNISIFGSQFTSNGNSDIALIKIDKNGEHKFSKQIGGKWRESFPPLGSVFSFDKEFNTYFAGTISYTCPDQDTIQLDGQSIVSNRANCLLLKMDSLGSLVWAKSIGASGDEFSGGIALLKNQLYYNLGNLNSGGTYDLDGIITNIPMGYDGASIIVRADTNGKAKWAKNLGAVANNSSFISGYLASYKNKISIVSKGDISRYEYENGPTKFGSGDYSYCIATYDTSGNMLWNTVSQGFGEQNIADIEYGNDGNLYALGYMNFWSYFPNDTLKSQGSDDLLLVCYDSVGNPLWAKNGGGTGTDITRGLAIGTDNSIYISGATTSSTFSIDKLNEPTPGSKNLFLLKLSPVALSVSNIDPTANTIEVFPNPANASLHIRWQDEKIEKIYLYDLAGRRILHQGVLSKQKQTKLTIPYGLSKGVYLLKLRGANQSYSKKIEIK
jgi:hypothetical protein